MGKASRTKGARGENEVRDLLREAGYTATRSPQSGGMQWKGDLVNNQGQPCIPGIHLEIKRAERWSLPAWIKQATDDCPPDHSPVVVFRSNRDVWRVCQSFEDWLSLVRGAA